MKLPAGRLRDAVLCVLLGVMTCAAYGRVDRFGFLLWDDPMYVTLNARVREGLSWRGLGYAATTFNAANWHPVTWLSHMLDVSLFGLNPGPHHLVSLAFHVLNGALLFLLLRAMTGRRWPSFLCAALFLLHPLHVESVAWIAERKDVLSTCLGLLSLLAWQHHVRTGSRPAGLGALVAYLLGLMAKPMLVSLPLLMLLLDHWPLARFQPFSWSRLGSLVREKAPFFALAAGSCVMSVFVQGRGGAISGGGEFGLGFRLLNALSAYGRYLGKLFWPVDLSYLYPFQSRRELWATAAATLAVLGLLGALAWRWRKRRPWLLVGLGWYLLALLPVIGLVQVGSQSMADRYTYLPLIGPCAVLAWLCAEAAERGRLARGATGVACAAALAAFGVLTRAQAATWTDDVALNRQALKATGNQNPTAHLNLGNTYLLTGHPGPAVEELQIAVRMVPDSGFAHQALGRAYLHCGRLEEALPELKRAYACNPRDYGAVQFLWRALLQLQRLPEAVGYLRIYLDQEPVRLRSEFDPDLERQHSQRTRIILGLALKELGRDPEAIQVFRQAQAADPRDATVALNLGEALGRTGATEEAKGLLRQASALAPRDPLPHLLLARLLAPRDRAGAALEFRKTLELSPDDPDAMAGLAHLGKD